MNDIPTIPLLSALVPAIVLLAYIYWNDRKSPEPLKQLLKATALGVLSIPLTYLLVVPVELAHILPDEVISISDAVSISFLGAALPEELAKLIVLWLFLRRNPHFDERMDGIVYAVCVSLGFAGLENIMYVLGDSEWMSVALQRAFTAVPGHFCFGVLMGYFVSLAKFVPAQRIWYSALALIVPVLVHGIYDTILFSMGTSFYEYFDTVLTVVFIVFCFLLWRWASRSIKKHLN